MRRVARITVWYEDGTSRGVPIMEAGLCAECLRKMTGLERQRQGRKPGAGASLELMQAMRTEDGLTLREIAEIMGITKQAVAMRLRGIKRPPR